MKTIIKNYLSIAFICCFALIACINKKLEVKTDAQYKIDAGIKTLENMQSAYKGERTAYAKYEAFSRKAEQEGLHNIAILYNAVASAEYIHGNNHKAVIEDAGDSVPVIKPAFTVKTTKENLYDDVNGEDFEAKTMYPAFLKSAETADNQTAALSLSYAMRTELKHKIFFQQALGDINSNTLNSLPPKYFVCPVCGNTYTHLPKHCDFSFTEGNKFIVFQ